MADLVPYRPAGSSVGDTNTEFKCLRMCSGNPIVGTLSSGWRLCTESM